MNLEPTLSSTVACLLNFPVKIWRMKTYGLLYTIFDPRAFKFFLKFNLGICIPPTQPLRPALGAESRVYYSGNTADRQTQWALTYCYLSKSTANQNGKLIHWHRWDSNLWSVGCYYAPFLTTWPSPTLLWIPMLVSKHRFCFTHAYSKV
jgi:hypothetical protein